MNALPHIVGAINWPVAIVVLLVAITVVTLAVVFREPISGAISRVQKVKATAKGVELTLERLEQQTQLAIGSRVELSRLSGNDIWALDDFANKRIETHVEKMKPAQKVAARTLVELKLLKIVGTGEQREVATTPLGQKILLAADSIL